MITRRALAAAVMLSVAACAPAAQQGTSGTLRTTTRIEVQNDYWSEVAVYLVRGPMRTRLGSVMSMSKGEFTIPNAYVVGVSDLTVQADPIGSHDSYVSPPIQVFPGAKVELKVAQRLSFSHFAVYATK